MNSFKKFIIGMTAAAMLASTVAMSASALSSTGTVKVGTSLNVRSSASTSSSVLGSLYNGNAVNIIGGSGNFYKITFNGKEGYVSKTYVTVKPITGTVKVTTTLNVRASASTSSAVLGSLKNGNTVSIIGETGTWYVINYNGAIAYVSSSYVTVGSTSGNSSKVDTVIAAAKSVIGTPYKFASSSPEAGFDCSGLVKWCFEKVGVTLPHNSTQQSTMGTYVSRANLKPGDIVFFSTNGTGSINHNGIYIGNNKFINAQSGAGKVIEADLTISYWSNAYVTARRVIN